MAHFPDLDVIRKQPPEEIDAVRDGADAGTGRGAGRISCGSRATLWAGTSSRCTARAAEGPGNLRPAGVRLMPTVTYQRTARRAGDLFRPHGGRCLDAADLGRAGRPHPRHRARRPRRDAPARCCRWLPQDLTRRAPARRRLRHRRAWRSRRRGAARTWSRSICRPTLVSAGAGATPRAISAPAAIEFRVGDMLDPDARPVRSRGRDGFADPLPRRRTPCGCWRASPRAPTSRCCSPSRRARRRWP